RIDDVVGLEALLDVDAKGAEALALRLRDVLRPVGKVAHVSDAGPHGVAVAEVAGDRPCLRGRLDDDEALGHRRDTLAPVHPDAGPRYSREWVAQPGERTAGHSSSSTATRSRTARITRFRNRCDARTAALRMHSSV